MLENQLFLVVRLQDDGILVKTLDPPRKLLPAHQVIGEVRRGVPRFV